MKPKRAPRKPPNLIEKKNITQIVRREINKDLEKKYFDYVQVLTGVDYTTGYINSLFNGIARGDGTNEFQGNEVTPTKVYIRYNGLVADNTNLLRVLVLQYKSTASPTLATILANNGSLTTPLAPLNRSYTSNFKVLYDKLHHLEKTTGFEQITGKIFIPAKRLIKTHFAAGSTTIERGNIFFAAITDSSIASHPQIQVWSRVDYTDA